MRKLLLVAMLLSGAVCAYADSTEFTFIAWNDGNWQNGFPYYIQPVSGPSALLQVMCDDYYHGGQPGEMWDANITQLGSNNISLARFNNVVAGPTALSPLLLYDEAGWILLQTQVEPTNQYQAMNYAVWYIFDPTQTPCNGGCQMWITNAENAAANKFPDTDFDSVYIITPTDQHDPNPNSAQEFLAIGPDSGLLTPSGSGTVPEPGTLALLGTGLLATVGRKRFH